MKHINHLGSAALLSLAVFLAGLLLLPTLGVDMEWKPKTTPSRLLTNPFIGWCLVVTLGIGLALIRLGSQIQQCATALVLAGMIFGLAMVSGMFWDAWLSPMLVFATLPVLRSAVDKLKSGALSG